MRFVMLFCALCTVFQDFKSQCVVTSYSFNGCSLSGQTFTNQLGLNNGNAPNPNCNFGAGSILTSTWMKFTYEGPAAMKYIYASQANGGAQNNPAAAVYSADGCVCLACSATAANLGPGEAVNDAKIDLSALGLTVGAQYLLRVYNEGTTANVRNPSVKCVPAPPCGDDFTNPCVITNINTTFTSSTNGSHPSDGCTFPFNSANSVSQLTCSSTNVATVDGNVWYTFNTCASGVVTATLQQIGCDNTNGSQIWMLSGNCNGGVANFSVVGNQCYPSPTMGDTYLSATLTAGSTYYVMVDSYGGNVCNFQLSMSGPVCSILPINLLNFYCRLNEENHASINWTVANEKNCDYYSVEKSTDGSVFYNTGKVNSKSPDGSNPGSCSYTFVDKKPEPGISYYRIVQFDKSGFSIPSKLAVIENKSFEETISVSPIPAKNTLQVDYNIKSLCLVKMVICDSKGNLVYVCEDMCNEGKNSKSIDMSGQQDGIYFLRVEQDGKSFRKRFFKISE